MTFTNSILAGTSLVRQAIQSPNYATASTGWTINQDGSAEFNSITIRGGSTVGGVSLWYNGTPGVGNLIFSISGAAGTDPFGNGYLEGITAYGSNSNVNIANGNVYFPGGLNTNGAPTITGIGGSAVTEMLIQSGTNSTSNFAAQATLLPGTSGAAPNTDSTAAVAFAGPAGQAVDIRAGGYCVKVDSAGLTEKAHDLTAYVNSWTPASGANDHNGIWCRLLSIGGISIDGVVEKIGAVNNGEQIGTIATEFWPQKTRWISCGTDQGLSGNIVSAMIQVAPNGNVYYFGPTAPSGSTTRIFITGMYMRENG
jgi:hypothetical protein